MTGYKIKVKFMKSTSAVSKGFFKKSKLNKAKCNIKKQNLRLVKIQ